jgi:hypothetical protein
MSYLMHMYFIVTFCLNYLIIIIYYFAYIGTYVGDASPQHEDEVMDRGRGASSSNIETPHATQDGYESLTRGGR